MKGILLQSALSREMGTKSVLFLLFGCLAAARAAFPYSHDPSYTYAQEARVVKNFSFAKLKGARYECKFDVDKSIRWKTAWIGISFAKRIGKVMYQDDAMWLRFADPDKRFYLFTNLRKVRRANTYEIHYWAWFDGAPPNSSCTIHKQYRPPSVPKTPSTTLSGRPPSSSHMRVCYYSNWSQYRAGSGIFTPDDIDPFLCTHLIYSFAKLDPSFQLAKYEYNDEQLYATFNNLKSTNPNLKTLLALGGASANSAHFSDLVSDPTRRQNFASSAIDYLRQYGFDGLDMDWEYPTQHGGRASDKSNFVLLLEDLRTAFDSESNSAGKPPLLLTAAVAAGKYFIDLAYDIPGMEKSLDFINLMAYDFHGSWENQVGHNSPLSAGARDSNPTLNVEWAANYWHTQGVAKEKLVIGLATYGRTFTLTNPSNYNIGDPVTGAGTPGPYTGEAGFLAYYEICAILNQSNVDQYWEPDSKVPYAVSGNQWIGYENVRSFTEKLNWIRDGGFGGAMVWNIDLDDFRGDCSSSTRPYPLMSLMTEVLTSNSNTSSAVSKPTVVSKTTSTGTPPSSSRAFTSQQTPMPTSQQASTTTASNIPGADLPYETALSVGNPWASGGRSVVDVKCSFDVNRESFADTIQILMSMSAPVTVLNAWVGNLKDSAGDGTWHLFTNRYQVQKGKYDFTLQLAFQYGDTTPTGTCRSSVPGYGATTTSGPAGR